MSASGQTGPSLRLVGDTPAPHRADLTGTPPAHGVIEETRAAARLSADEAAAIFAIRVQSQLQAGRAAVLTPERRRALIAGSVGLGIKAFDANLVIAVVQSAVRAGDDPLARLRSAVPGRSIRRASRLTRLLLAAVLAAAALVWLVVAMRTGR